MVDWSDEVFAPLLDCGSFTVWLCAVELCAVNPVKVRLEVAVAAGYVSDFDAEEKMAAVIGPAEIGFLSLIVG